MEAHACPRCHFPLSGTTPPEIVRSWNCYEANFSTKRIIIANCWEFKLTHSETLVFMAMLRANGRACSIEYFMDYCYGDKPDCDTPDPKIIDIVICKLKKQLGPFRHCIENIWGAGYRLVPFSKAAEVIQWDKV